MDEKNFNETNEQQSVYYQAPEQSVYYQKPEQPVYQGQVYAQPVKKPDISGLSIAGLVIGITAILSSCVLNWISVVIAVVGLILAIIGQIKSKSGLGIAAIIVSALGIVFGIFFFCLYMYILLNLNDFMHDLPLQ